MKSNIKCECGKVSGTATMSITKHGKPILSYEVQGIFYTNRKEGVLFCISCDTAACTSGDWK
jgi:hypothetical protein